MVFEERAKVLDFAEQLNLWTKPSRGRVGVLGEAGLPILKSLLRKAVNDKGLRHSSYAVLQSETGFDYGSIAIALEQLEATGIIKKSKSNGRICIQVMER
jgi:hypothetical protein